MEKIFDLFFGLPLHPLVVHVVAVFLPVFSMAVIAAFFFKNIREKYGLIIQVGLGIAAVSAFVAEQSGEALSIRVGTPMQHAELGENLVLIAVGLFISSVAWFYLQKHSKSILTKFVGLISIFLAAAALVFSVLVGHTGAKAAWEEKLNPKPISQETTTNSQSSNSDSNSNAKAMSITLDAAEVAKHNNPSDCWTIVNNEVYDLTAYINSHPGGVPNILRLCGIDGSKAFQAQHAGQNKPNSQLSNLVIGKVGQVLEVKTTDSNSNQNNSSSKPAPTNSTNTNSATLTSSEVAKHNSINDCWTVVNNEVYNLTSYVNSHPGGVKYIEQICGKDGSVLFQNQHSNQSRPNNTLAGLLLGSLTDSSSNLSKPTKSVGGEEEGDDD